LRSSDLVVLTPLIQAQNVSSYSRGWCYC